MTYRLALPTDLEGGSPVFHVFVLRKYLHDPLYVIHPQEAQLDEALSYEKTPVVIFDRQVKKLHLKEIPSVKVLWWNHSDDEAT